MTTVRIEDCRALKYCTLGVRRFFRKHDLCFETFLRDGIPATDLPQDDYLAQTVIQAAMQRENNE